MPKQKTTSGAQELNLILREMNDKGEFPASILTDDQGLTIAAAAQSNLDPDRHSAVVAYMQKAMLQVCRQLEMGQVIEITLLEEAGRRLVCRTFRIGDHDLILSVIVPAQHSSYRRLTSRVITRISRIWANYWE